MRIISQDGMLDLPYESIAITVGRRGNSKEFYIFAHLVNSAEPRKDPQILSTYSTEEKVENALDMLHQAYACERYFQFPSDEDVSGSGTKRSKSFGEKVLNILKHKGISQRELAEKVGCTEVSMSRYISGERVPKAPIVVKIADVLGVTVEYLVSDSIE